MVSPSGVTSSAFTDEDEERWQRQLTTLVGWRQFVTDVWETPVLLPTSELKLLTASGRDAYDDRRIDHHARLGVFETSDIRRVIIEGRRLGYLNRHADYGRSGLMVSGAPRTGKTTAIVQMGKTIELIQRNRYPHASNRIPVVYLTTPPTATPKMLAMEFARFLGLDIPSRKNMTEVLEMVCNVLITARTCLVLVDELHNISVTERMGSEVSDTLKYFSERIPATFVYAGIDIEDKLLSGTRGGQIAGRFSLVHTAQIPLGTQWRSLLSALEDSLRLHHHRAGTLLDLDTYIHHRTKGTIGSLLRLVRIAGVDAVLNGTEKITKKALAEIPLDIASTRAETARPGK